MMDKKMDKKRELILTLGYFLHHEIKKRNIIQSAFLCSIEGSGIDVDRYDICLMPTIRQFSNEPEVGKNEIGCSAACKLLYLPCS